MLTMTNAVVIDDRVDDNWYNIRIMIMMMMVSKSLKINIYEIVTKRKDSVVIIGGVKFQSVMCHAR